MHRVFVYGSLMRGFGNHVLLQDQTFIGNATVAEFALHSLGGFPAAVPDDGNAGDIRGEVYEVDDAALARLDRLEGHPTFYERQDVEVWSENLNGYLPAQMYVYQHHVDAPVPNGDWREYNATPRKSHALRG